MPEAQDKAPGRPRKARDGGLLRQRGIRLSDAEWRWCQDRAEESGLPVSEWCRRRLLGRLAKP